MINWVGALNASRIRANLLRGTAPLWATVMVFGHAPASLAHAPEAGTDEEGAAAGNIAPGDIVVTAQRRSERLQDVPLAVTALTADALESRRIDDTLSLTRVVPSLSFTPGNNPVNSGFRLRGIGSQLFGLGNESSVSLVVDGVVAARSAQSFADFADLERSEVLRGPQGTLFGKNATAGVISITTAPPSHQWEGNASITIAEQDEWRLKGSVSGPLTDTLRVRVSGYSNDVGGYLPNPFTGRASGGNRSEGLRGKLEWQPAENLILLLTGDYREANVGFGRNVVIGTDNAIVRTLLGPIEIGPENRSVAENLLSHYTLEQETYSLEAGWDIGDATITSLTAFQRFRNENVLDSDGFNTSLPIYTGGNSGNFTAQWDLQEGINSFDNFSQKIRINSNGNRRFNYVSSLYYSDISVDRGFARRRAYCEGDVIGQPCAPGTVRYESMRWDARLKGSSYAAFGQVDYRLVDKLKVIGGLRITHDDVRQDGVRTLDPLFAGDAIIPGTTASSGRSKVKATALSGKAVLQYEFNRDAQVYGSYTRGYKGPGLDDGSSARYANQSGTRPEYVDAYEAGFKATLADGLLSIAADAFLAKYTDLQVQVTLVDPVTAVGTVQQTNAGKSTTKGFEVDLTLRPSRNFSVNGAIAYTDATIDVNGVGCPVQYQSSAPVLATDFPINQCYRPHIANSSGTLVTGNPLQDLRGARLPGAPKWRFTISPRFEHDIGELLAGFAQVSIDYQSSQQYSLDQNPETVQGAFALVDLNLGVRAQDNRYSLTFFVKNLFDKNYYTGLGYSALVAKSTGPYTRTANFSKDSSRYAGFTLAARF